MAFHIRRRKYDWAIVMTGSFKSAVVPWLAGVPCRTGTTHEFRSKLINDNRVADISKFPLSIDRACLLALDKNEMVQPGFAEWPTFTCNAEDSAITLERLAVKTGKQKIIALAPGSDGGEAKRWPAECYAETANGLLNNGFRVMLIGSATDIEISHRIQAATQNRCIDLCGKTSLEQAVHLISQAAAVVCNDSGLMHVASALGKPVVAIFGPTHSGHTPPLSDSAQIISLRIPCSPCYERKCPLGHHKCMREIRPNSVIEDVQRIVNPGKS
jgi:heptosyltransferase-2